jgi:hypothetical protein
MKRSQVISDSCDVARLQEFQQAVLYRFAEMDLRIAELEARLAPRQREPELAAKILHAIAGARGSEPFKVRELYKNPVLKKVFEGLSSKQLGKLLAACEGKDVDGRTVKRYFNVPAPRQLFT